MTLDDKPPAKPKLRWFQFSMRTLLIVMLLVGCGLGWLIHDVREQAAVVKMIEERGGFVEFGEPSFLGRMVVVRSLFGEHAFVPIRGVSLLDATDAHIVKLKKFTRIQWLQLAGKEVTNLSPLADLNRLTSLDLSTTRVTDLSPLAGLTRLQSIHIGSNQKLQVPDRLSAVLVYIDRGLW